MKSGRSRCGTLILRAILVPGIVFLGACGGGGGPADPAPTPPSTDTTPPSIPSGIAATATSDTQIDLSWNASMDSGGSGLGGYRIYRDGSTTALATVTAPSTTYADTGLTANTQYSYVVRAFDVAGNQSDSSATAMATTQGAPVSGTAGLDARPSNATCLAWARPATGSIQLQPFTNLTFNASVGLLQAPNDNNAWYVVEQGGTVRRFEGLNPAGYTTFASLPVTSGGERGLLGMAFHPQFPADNRVFLSYTIANGGTLQSRVSSFTSDGATLNAASEKVLLTLNQPEDNHNGGNIGFGKDGYLYIGFGDGGGGGDQHGDPGNGQRLTTLLGKMLRIDVSPAAGYDIPTDNPFAGNAKCTATGGSASCPEIYAWGFRNPWRWSFDRSTGDLWVGDVGQNAWEEVDQVRRGGNYGWRCREGAHDYNSAGTTGCSTAASIDPLTEYDHSVGTAITGGFVYRGPQDTPFKGRYLFGDSGSGRIWAWIPENATVQSPRKPTELASNTGLSIVSFGQGNDGELYVVNYSSLYRIVFQAPSSGGTVPEHLSDTGCVNPADVKQPADGLIPYAINAPFWSDGATKDRWMGLPDGSKITVQSSGDWDFPNGTVLMKTFTVGSRLIETRLFMRHADDGTWGGYTYSWNDAQTDAMLVRGGAVRDIGNNQQWLYPSEAQCLQCHTSAAGHSLGLETAQLNRNFTYPQTGRTANELFTLNHIQTLTPAIPDPAAQPALTDPSLTSAALNDRARAWLHTNCSQCHRPGGPTPSTMDLRYTTPLAQTGACNAPPQSGDLGLGSSARLIAPGNAGSSIIVNRSNRRDANAMPPVASNVVDSAGVQLLTQWINGLAGC